MVHVNLYDVLSVGTHPPVTLGHPEHEADASVFVLLVMLRGNNGIL